jgi:hypothetical protein
MRKFRTGGYSRNWRRSFFSCGSAQCCSLNAAGHLTGSRSPVSASRQTTGAAATDLELRRRSRLLFNGLVRVSMAAIAGHATYGKVAERYIGEYRVRQPSACAARIQESASPGVASRDHRACPTERPSGKIAFARTHADRRLDMFLVHAILRGLDEVWRGLTQLKSVRPRLCAGK